MHEPYENLMSALWVQLGGLQPLPDHDLGKIEGRLHIL